MKRASTNKERNDVPSISTASSPSGTPVKTKRRPHWQKDELNALLQAALEKKVDLKGSFVGHSGGRASRELAWEYLCNEVNAVTDFHRKIDECQRKLQHFVSECKKKVGTAVINGNFFVLVLPSCL